MPLEEILNLIRAQPFVPFAVKLHNGDAYTVRHPELLLPGARSVIIGFNADPSAAFYEPGRTVTVSLMAVSQLEPLPSPAPTESNGQQ